MRGELERQISAHLRRLWAEGEPTARCFDRDAPRMALLVRFLDGGGDEAGRDDVREHLLECPRCRFIYARMREVGREG